MAHEIRVEGERALFAYLSEHGGAWHSLGKPWEDPDDRAAMLYQVGHNRTAVVRQAYSPGGKPLQAWYVGPKGDEAETWGAVSERFAPVQPAHLWDDAAPLLDDGWQVSAAGTLGSGDRTWITLTPPGGGKASITPGDDVVQYLTIANRNDGKTSYRGIWSATRVVCANTLAIAMASGSGVFSLKHVVGVEEKREQFRGAIASGTAGFAAQLSALRYLQGVQVSDSDARKLTAKVFRLGTIASNNAKAKLAKQARAVVAQAVAPQMTSNQTPAFSLDDILCETDSVVAGIRSEEHRIMGALAGGLDAIASRGTLSAVEDALAEGESRIMRRVMEFREGGRGAELAGRGSAHGLYQSWTEYLTHVAKGEGPQYATKRLDGQLFGSTMATDVRGFDLLLEHVGASRADFLA
jgi:Domain of unknown function (DUF932)